MSESDLELLGRYRQHGSEEAFAELVRRRLDLVHAAALRQVRLPHLAEEVAQAVFLKLARHAGRLAPDTILTAWLYQVARREAIDVVRRESRRQVREQWACAMNSLPSTENDWARIEPLLDEAMSRLNDRERASVLLRYFENKSLREVGEQLGISEDAAQKRVRRAVDQLRDFFARRGVAVGAQGIAAAVSAHAIQAAPGALALAISSAVAAAGTTFSGAIAASVTKGSLTTMTATHKALIAATFILAGAGLYEAREAAKLRKEVLALRQRQGPLEAQVQRLERERDDAVARLSSNLAPRLPAPRIQPAVVPSPESEASSVYERFAGKEVRLTREQTERYLAENGRSAASLLAAFRTSGEVALLNEAMQNFPQDPQVAFEASLRTDATAEMRLAWIEAFKKADPSNALPDYLAALAHIKMGQPDLAVQELVAASGKTFMDYTSERYQADTEAFLAGGYSVADAKTASGRQLLLPQLKQIKELGLNVIEMAKSYRQAGDESSARSALQMAAKLAQHYSAPFPGEPTVSQLVGIALERHALDAMDPAASWGQNGGTVQDRLDEIASQRSEIAARNEQVEAILPKMTDQDWINYRDRWLTFGEANAVQWVIGKYEGR